MQIGKNSTLENRRHPDRAGADRDVLHQRVLIDTADEAAVFIKKLHLKISNMTGRVQLEDVPLDVGPPIMHTTEASLSLKLNPEHTAVVALPRESDDQPLIFLLLQTRVVAKPEAGGDK